MRILSLVCHPQRNKISPLSCQSRVALYAYTFGVHAYDTHVSHIVQSSNKPCSHTLCALSRSLVRLLTRSLAASGFEISAAVVDVRCPRSDRGPGTRREPRRDRVQDRSIHFQRIFGSCRRESTRLFLTTVLRSAVSTKCCQIIANTKKRMK